MKRSELCSMLRLGSVLNDEIVLRPEDDGRWVSKIVDPCHVAMMRIDVPDFAVTDGPKPPVGIEPKKILEVLKIIKDKEVTFSYERTSKPDSRECNGIMSFRASVDGCEVEIGRGMEIGEPSEPKVPNLNLAVNFITTTARMKRALRLAEGISDHVSLGYSSNDKMVWIGAENKEHGDRLKYCMSAAPAELEGIFISLFPHDYLGEFVNAVDPAVFPDMTLRFGKDEPIKIDLLSGDGMKVTYLLAPRIEND